MKEKLAIQFDLQLFFFLVQYLYIKYFNLHSILKGTLESIDQLRSLVFEQWLSSDLSEIGEAILPNGILQAETVDLKSTFPLQVILWVIGRF